MGGYKEAGRFLYSYMEDGTVVVAYRGLISNTAGQQLVHRAMSGITKHTGKYCDVLYDGYIYIGLAFENVPEKQLIAALTRKIIP